MGKSGGTNQFQDNYKKTRIFLQLLSILQNICLFMFAWVEEMWRSPTTHWPPSHLFDYSWEGVAPGGGCSLRGAAPRRLHGPAASAPAGMLSGTYSWAPTPNGWTTISGGGGQQSEAFRSKTKRTVFLLLFSAWLKFGNAVPEMSCGKSLPLEQRGTIGLCAMMEVF